jgi:hypothetical protein
MGMFDSMYDAEGHEWQTKALGRALNCWNIGDQVPSEVPDFQVEVGRFPDPWIDAIATVRGGVLTAVPDRRHPELILIDYVGGIRQMPDRGNLTTD